MKTHAIRYADRVRNIPPGGTPIRRIALAASKLPHVSDLSQGQPTGYPVPKGLLDMVAHATKLHRYKLYPPTRGTDFSRNAIARDFSYQGGPSVDYEQVIVTGGVTKAIDIFALSLINPGDRAIIIGPTYALYRNAVERCGGKVDWVMIEPDGTIDFDKVKKAIFKNTKALFINTPNNPTGNVFSRRQLKELAKICIEKNLPVFADEVYDRMTYGKPTVHMASIPGMEKLTFTANSISKIFGAPGFRFGWMIAPSKKDAEQIIAMNDMTVVGAPHPCHDPVGIALLMANNMSFDQAVVQGPLHLREFKIDKPDISGDYYEEVNSGCKSRAETLIEALRQCGYKVNMPQGAYYLWAELPEPGLHRELKTADELADWHMESVGVAGIPGSVFGPSDAKNLKHKFRFSAGRASDAILLAVNNLKEYWKP